MSTALNQFPQREFIDTATAAGLGPIATVQVDDGGDEVFLRVELEPAGTVATARLLLRWADAIEAIDMIAGRRTAADQMVRLNLRGRLDQLIPVVVVAVFTDPAAVAVIDAHHRRWDPHHLLQRLATG